MEPMSIERIEYGGWKNNVRLSNAEVELIITADVGPRVIRFGYIDERNVFGEIPDQIGGVGEDEWMIRGGHRLWIAPEEKPKSYELDNSPYNIEDSEKGVRLIQEPGAIAGVEKIMEVSLDASSNEVTLLHKLVNKSRSPVEMAVWALTVMALEGMAVIPLPEKIPHTDRLTHNQEWSIWGYTDFSDSRWTLGARYVFFRQDSKKGASKVGIAHREGWVGYLLGEYLFVKRFNWVDGATYTDGGVNFETFSNEEILDLESLSPLTTVVPGQSIEHVEKWSLHKGVPPCATEADIERHVLPFISAKSS